MLSDDEDVTVVDTPPEQPVAEEEVKPKRGAKKAARKMANGRPRIAKGGKWERDVGKQLSLWITRNERNDIFRRNVLSGGRFTQQVSRSEKIVGLPGDIAISHPLAADFVSAFCVEAKHVRDCNLMGYLFGEGNSFLSKVVSKIEEQAKAADLEWFVIVKQNNKPPFLLMSADTGAAANRCATVPLRQHLLHNGSVLMATLDAFVSSVNPVAFVKKVVATPATTTAAPRITRRPVAPPPKITRRPIAA